MARYGRCRLNRTRSVTLWWVTGSFAFAAALGGAGGCSRPTEPGLGDTGGESASGTATTGSGTSAATTPSTTTSETTSSTAAGSESSTATESDGAPDLPPFPEACLEPMPTITLERGTTPNGELHFDEARLVSDYCTRGPVLSLRDSAAGEEVFCILGSGELLGTQECQGGWPQTAEVAFAEVLEPFEDPNWEYGTQGLWLHARLFVQGGGWDVEVEVEVPDCGETACYCACE